MDINYKSELEFLHNELGKEYNKERVVELNELIQKFKNDFSNKDNTGIQWKQKKRKNYILMTPINKDVINNIILLYEYYNSILDKRYDDIDNYVSKLSNNYQQFELINMIKYPLNFIEYINKNKYINIILNLIYEISSFYIIIKLLKIDYNSISDYISGIIITNNINILTSIIISSSNTENELWLNLEKVITHLMENNSEVSNNSKKLLLLKNVNISLINEIILSYKNIKSIKIYSQINIDTFFISGSLTDIEKFQNIINCLEKSQNESFIPYRDRIPEIKTNLVDILNIDYIRDTNILNIFNNANFSLPIYYNDNFDNLCLIDSLENLNEYLFYDQYNWNQIFLNLYNINKESINIIDISSKKCNCFLLELLYNIYGTSSKWFCFNIIENAEINNTLYTRNKFFIDDLSILNYHNNWEKKYGSNIIKTKNKSIIENKFTKFFKTEPIIIGGLLQSVSSISSLLGAYSNGHFCEISTIELIDIYSLRNKINKIIRNISPGEAIIINISTLEEWEWKFDLLLSMKDEGVPIGGITISGNFLKSEQIIDIIKKLVNKNIYVLGLLPQSIDDITILLNIVQDYENVKFLFYCNSFFSGNLRSIEDLYQPIIKSYHLIRKYENIFLINSADYIDLDESYKYLTGEWSNKYNVYSMPFDAVVINYKLLIVKECTLSAEHKKLIKNVTKIHKDDEWEKVFMDNCKEYTVINIYNKPFHVILTKATKLWKKYEREYFFKNAHEREVIINMNKEKIITDLEKDYMKKYIGDLNTMTYYDLLKRCTNLMTYNNSSNWIHTHYEWKVKELIKWIIGKYKLILAIGYEHDSYNILKYIEDNRKCNWTYPIFNDILSVIDIDFFLDLCDKKKYKPVNFIPIIDTNLEYWFTLDIIWYSETLNAVPDFDVTKTIIPFTPYGVYNNFDTDITLHNFIIGYNKILIDNLNQCDKGDINENKIEDNKEITLKKIKLPNNEIISYIKDNLKFIVLSLEKFIFQPNIYRNNNESTKNYIPEIISSDSGYIEINRKEIIITGNNENDSEILTIKYYDDSSKIKMEIPIILSTKLKTTICIYYNYKKYCWQYPIQEDRNKIIQFNKYLDWIFNIYDKKKSIFINRYDLIDLENYTKISNKFNLYLLTVIYKTFIKIFIWLNEEYNINYIGSIILSHSIEVIESRLNIDNNTKLDIYPFIRSYETKNNKALLTIITEVKTKNTTLMKILINIKIGTCHNNITCKHIYEYNYRLSTIDYNINLFLKKYKGFSFISNVDIDDYPIIDIYMEYNEYGYNGIIMAMGKKIGNITTFEKKYLKIFEQYGKQLNRPVYTSNKEILNKSQYLYPFYEKFLEIIQDYNPIYYSDSIAVLFNYKSKVINSLWLVSKIFENIKEDIMSYSVENDVILYNVNKVELYIKNVGNRLGYKVNNAEIRNNEEIIMNCELIVKSNPAIYLFSDSTGIIPELGKNIYEKSEIYKHIIDISDTYINQKYGLSIKYIMDYNPVEYSVILNTNEKKNKYKKLGIINNDNINIYKFINKKGLIYFPLFSQIISVIYQKALYMEKIYDCTLNNNFRYTGKGTGELASILICTNIFSIQEIIDIFFEIGCIFLNEYDADIYRSVSINPLNLNMDGAELEKILNELNKQQKTNIEISFYSIEDYQYIVTGKMIDLLILKEYLENKEIRNINNKKKLSQLHKKLSQLYKNLEKKDPDELIDLYTYNPLYDIYIPYNTKLLDKYINSLYKTIYYLFDKKNIDVNELENKYISNLTHSYFELNQAYLNKIIDITNDKRLIDLNKIWDTVDEKTKITKILTSLISYQFIKPINWIKVQEYIMNKNIVESMEFGAKNTLSEILIKTAEIYDYKIDITVVSNKQYVFSSANIHSNFTKLKETSEKKQIYSYDSGDVPSDED